MLSEADVEELADSIVGGEEERMVAEIFDELVASLARGGRLRARDEQSMRTLARESRSRLDSILAAHRSSISDEAAKAIRAALDESVSDDAEALSAAHPGVAVSEQSLHQTALVEQTVAGVSSVIARQNVALVDNAADTWWKVAGKAIADYDLGLDTEDRIIARSVSALHGDGIRTIAYDSGATASADVAIRRHIVTQTGQAAGRATEALMDAYGHELVVTSAHFGSRPTHEPWQGRAFHRGGGATIGGVYYPDFVSSTGYGDVAGLLGANCMHSFGPYFPGVTEVPELPETVDGMTSDEMYAATQRQRSLERRIRSTKADIAGMEKAGLGLESPDYVQKRLVLGRQQAKLRGHCAATGLTRQPKREKAYGVGKQPRALGNARA